MIGVPNLSDPKETFGILTQHARQSQKIAIAGNGASYKNIFQPLELWERDKEQK